MPPTSCFPTLLPPRNSLTLVTSALGCPSSWLVLQALHAALSTSSSSFSGAQMAQGDPSGSGEPALNGVEGVVLVSFLRDVGHWVEGERGMAKAGRVIPDLHRLSREGRFAFVDGLTEFFMPILSTPSIPIEASGGGTPPSAIPKASTPAALQISKRSPLPSHPQSRIPSASLTPAKSLRWTNGVDGLEIIEKDILDVIGSISRLSRKATAVSAGDSTSSEKNVMLVIEGLDLLLASTGVAVVEIGELVMGLREKANSIILVISADSPLVHLPTSPTPLETTHSSFLISLAHQARTVYQLRSLDTGTARDVSGVVRVSSGGDNDEEEEGEGEYLFHIGGSGSVGGGGGDVRVWVRGETGQ